MMRPRPAWLLLALALGARPADDPPPFSGSLDAREQPAQADPRPEYAAPPLTLDLWARFASKASFNIAVAYAPKESPEHWELYTTAGTGTLAAYLPGSDPAVLDSGADVVDDRWHHLAMIYEPARVRLFVDTKPVLDREVRSLGRAPAGPGPLWFGAYPPGAIGCAGSLDEVRLRRGAHPPAAVPNAPPGIDPDTIGLWRFDAIEGGRYPDASTLANAARPGVHPLPPPEFDADALDYRPADPSLTITVLDRSPGDSWIAVRPDAAGRLFVGGRKRLAVLEPDAASATGFAPPRTLFEFPDHSWISDIAIRGDDLFVATSAALYRLPGARLARANLEPERIVWGTPVDLHVTYHGLAFGPEGRLWFNSGDPLLNYGDFSRPDHWGHWTVFHGPERKATPYTGVGGVFRVAPDGSDFEVIAGGLRGSDGVCFDRRWEFFTNDNDHESLPDRYTPFRILHVTPGADFGWPRGWAARRDPDRADLLDPVNPGLTRGVPVGQGYTDGSGLPETYRDSLLVAQWGHRSIVAYPLHPEGSSYAAEEERPFLVGEGRARPVGLAVGPGGRVFAAIAYMAQNEGSPTYASDLVLIHPKGTPAVPVDTYEPTAAPEARLWVELSNPDWIRREAAHGEILRRGGALLDEAIGRLDRARPDDPARPHLVWLAAAARSNRGRDRVADLVREEGAEPDPVLRLQAFRALDAFGLPATLHPRCADATIDPDERVALAALTALERANALPRATFPPVWHHDRRIRQAAARAWARRGLLEQIERDGGNLGLNTGDDATKLGFMIALGLKLTAPDPTAPLPEALPLTYTSGNAIFSVPYASGTVDLRGLGRVGSFTAAERWKALPHTPEEERLFATLMLFLGHRSEAVRLQAAYYLSLLDDPRAADRVAEVTGTAADRRLAEAEPRPVASLWVLGPVPESVAGPAPDRPIDLSDTLATPDGPLAWRPHDDAGGALALDPSDGTSFALLRLSSRQPAVALLRLRSDEPVTVWHNGRTAYENEGGVVAGRTSVARLKLVAGTNDVLVRFRHREWRGLEVTLAVQAPAGVSVERPEDVGGPGLTERLKAAAGTGKAVPEAFLTVDWEADARRGDPARGRALFGPDGIGCAKCHALEPGQAGGGAPSLADAGRRFTVAQLVESILAPDRQVAPEFRGAVLALDDGRVVSGLVVGETADAIEILQPDATRLSIPTATVEERRPMDGSPMPTGLVVAPEELRDLLAYLLGAGQPAAGP